MNNIKKITYLIVIFLSLMSLTSCSSSSSSSNNTATARNFTPPTCSTPAITANPPSGANVMPVTVSNCNNSSVNIPFVSVKICAPGSTSNCQTLNNILLDTGSYGLRVYSGMLNSTLLSGLTPVTSGSNTVAECVGFADGTSLWGSVAQADVVLGDLSGSETAANTSIQLIDSQYGNPSVCPGADTDPYVSGFTGILGVGLFTNDCPSCVSSTAPRHYWACSGSSCALTTLSAANQVTNPVANLTTDDQGISLTFLAVNTSTGSAPVTGYMLLGINSRVTGSGFVSNASTGKTLYSANANGDFQARYNGIYYASFIDSGSNGLFFPNNSSIAVCGAGTPADSFLCPSPSTTISPTFTGCTSGQLASSCTGNASTPTFTIYNANSLASTGNSVFSSIAAPINTYFDLGFPFFTGRTVFVGIQGKTSTGLGTGPYWAF